MSEQVLAEWVSFGAEARRLREQAGMTLSQLADRIPFGTSMVSKVERATRAPKRDYVDALEAAFGTRGDLLARWSSVKKAEADPGWYMRVTAAEQHATEIRMYHSSLIPGRFQTEAYARAILRDCRPLNTPDQIEELVQLRLKLLPALLKHNSPLQWVVLNEEVVRDTVDGSPTMAGQLNHLVRLVESGTIRLAVIPSRTPNYAGRTGIFRLISFADRLPLAYVEHASGGVLLDSNDEVQRLSAIFGELQSWALTPADSLDLVKKVRGELK